MALVTGASRGIGRAIARSFAARIDAVGVALLRHFGSVRRLRAATAEEILQVEGIGPKTAEQVVAALRGTVATPAPAVDTGTGEILD